MAVLAAIVGGFGLSSSTAAATPRSIWADGVTPRSGADPEVADVELGTQFRTSVPGEVRAIRYFRFAKSLGTSRGTLWDRDGRKLASVSFAPHEGEGWQRAELTEPVSLAPNVTYVVSYTSEGRYAGDQYYFGRGKGRRSGPLTATAGVYSYGSGFPTQLWRGSSYYADVEFVAGGATPLPPGSEPSPPPPPRPRPPRPCRRQPPRRRPAPPPRLLRVPPGRPARAPRRRPVRVRVRRRGRPQGPTVP